MQERVRLRQLNQSANIGDYDRNHLKHRAIFMVSIYMSLERNVRTERYTYTKDPSANDQSE